MEDCSRKLRPVASEAPSPFRQVVSLIHVGLLSTFALGLMLLSSHTTPITYDSTREESPIKHVELHIVSMNIALMEASKVAPVDWSMQDHTDALLRIILASDPHLIALQECPSAGWIYKTFPNHRVIGEKKSHSGFTTLLVRNDTFPSMELGALPGSDYSTASVGIPAVMGISSELAAASVHLEPFEEGALKRRAELDAIITASRLEGIPLVIAGDTNMRDAEDLVAEHSLGLSDAWKTNGSDISTHYTWDTTKHDSGTFNEFYGKSTRQVQRRYDRVYIYGANNVAVRSFQLLANTPIGESQNHFLSDHFGIAATLVLD